MRLRVELALAFALLSCTAATNGITNPEYKEKDAATWLSFADSRATSFTAADGRACAPVGGKFTVLGWESDHSEPACSHDTHYEGVTTATLELAWKGTIPRDGDFDLDTFDNGLQVWLDVVARGTWVGDSLASARVLVEGRADHCGLTWTDPIAHVATFGREIREAPYGGYRQVPPLRLFNCKGGEAVDVHVVLVADVTRGRVDVDSFGFRAASPYEADHVFGLVYREPGAPIITQAQPCSDWDGKFCTHTVLVNDNLGTPLSGRGVESATTLRRPHQ
jgi:hypothetical protein